jgi:hypothetical protein
LRADWQGLRVLLLLHSYPNPQGTMQTEHANRVLNDPQAVAAYAQFQRAPMQTDTATYRLAVDWLEAVLAVASAEVSS